MRLTSLLLYAAVWLTSTTLALVARPSNLQARGDTTLEFPEGYNAQTCPLDRSSVALTASPAKSEAFPPPASAPAAPKAAMTRRVLPQAHPAQFCRLIGRLAFTGAHYRYSYDGSTLEVVTPVWMQPGVYAVTVAGNSFIRGLSIAQHFPNAGLPPARIDNIVEDNPINSLGVQFIVNRPAMVHFRITFYGPNVAGEIGLFEITPSGSQELAQTRAGLDGPRRLRR